MRHPWCVERDSLNTGAPRRIQSENEDPVHGIVKRSLKSSLSDDGVTLGVAEQDAETAGIAKNLIARLTVRDPAKVPPVSYLGRAQLAE